MPTRIRRLGTRPIRVVISFLVISFVLTAGDCAFAFDAGARQNTPPPSDRGGGQAYQQWLTREVGHELNLLPWLTVFDNLQYQVNGSEVTLLGQVVNPVTKDDAQKAVKGIEGVTKINNKIEVLPLSPFDAQIRRAEYHAIYGEPQLQRYAMGTMPSIHIIVANGHVTLLGYVDNESDKNVAEIRAKSVPNVFSVIDNLQVRPGRPSTSQY
jgi:hyperosmotically inducible periplasmic protein